MTRVLVTGASGFVGSALVAALAADGWSVRAAARRRTDSVDCIVTEHLGPDADWRAALAGVEAVVHLAGPAHARHSEPHLRRAIALGTGALAAQAQAQGVQRFVFVSSIKAVAAHAPGRSLSERDAPAPQDAYGRAKLEAERAVLEQGKARAVILRPPLVVAANAKANFERLLRLADTALPLPFAGLDNQRSLITLASLMAAITAVLAKPDGRGGVFHVADQPALSTPAIIDALRAGLGRPARQFRAPGLSMLAPPALSESLAIDDALFRAEYGYGARGDVDMSAELARCAREWKARR